MFGKSRRPQTDTESLEHMSHWFDGRTGRRVVGGYMRPAGDDAIRFDFDGDVPQTIHSDLKEQGLESKSWLNHLWIWKRK